MSAILLQIQKGWHFYLKGFRYLLSFISPDPSFTKRFGLWPSLRTLVFWNTFFKIGHFFERRRRVYWSNQKQGMFVVNNYRELDRLDRFETKEPDTIEWIKREFREGEIFYDVGSNIGQYGIFCALHLNKNCKVYCFEPESSNFSRLNRNIALNRLSDVMIPLNVALSNKTDLALFKVTDLKPGYATHQLDIDENSQKNRFVYKHTQGILMVTLDALVSQFHFPIPHHVKIDVDGVEVLVLDGGRQFFSEKCLRTVSLEIDPENEVEVISRMTAFGFIAERTKGNTIFRRQGQCLA